MLFVNLVEMNTDTTLLDRLKRKTKLALGIAPQHASKQKIAC